MLRFFILIVFIFICPLYADTYEEFYILPMGQGNAQLVIYAQGSEKIGVLYDLGSKSLQTHPKFMKRGKWDIKYKPILQKVESRFTHINVTPKKGSSQIDPSAFQSPEPSSIKVHTPQEPLTINGKLSTTQQGSHKKNLELFIFDLLQDLSHLFIFISHSDEDHINYLNQKTIPDTVPLTILLCGDWFGNVGCDNEDTNITRNVKDVLKFLKARLQTKDASTQFSFTYYQDMFILKNPQKSIDLVRTSKFSVWSYSPDGVQREVKFNDFIREELESIVDVEPLAEYLKVLCSRDHFNLNSPISPSFYSGPFNRLYANLFPRNGNEKENTTAKPSLKEQVKNHIYVWSMNHLTDDINGQSIVLSCTLPSLNMSVILTGDAQYSTFQRIYNEYRGKNFRSVLNFSSDHLVAFILPHHGSRNNSSALGLMFFHPDIFGIAAGDGGRHGHPSYELIQNLKKNYFPLKLQNNFVGKYTPLKSGIDIIAIVDEKQKLVQTEEEEIPFLCPNLYGCIKWDRDGISTNFDNTLEYDGKDYKILYSSHVWECDQILLSRLKLNNSLMVKSAEEPLNEKRLVFTSSQKEENTHYYIFKMENTEDFFVGLAVDDNIYFYRILEA